MPGRPQIKFEEGTKAVVLELEFCPVKLPLNPKACIVANFHDETHQITSGFRGEIATLPDRNGITWGAEFDKGRWYKFSHLVVLPSNVAFASLALYGLEDEMYKSMVKMSLRSATVSEFGAYQIEGSI